MDENQQMTTAAGGKGVEARALEFASGIASRFRAMDPAARKRLGIAAGIAAGVAAGSGLVCDAHGLADALCRA